MNEQEAREKLIQLHMDVLQLKADIKELDQASQYIKDNKLVG